MAATYCFVCRGCDARWENSATKLGIHPDNGCDSIEIVRDYRSEAAGIGSGVRASRDKGVSEMRAFHEWTTQAAAAEGV